MGGRSAEERGSPCQAGANLIDSQILPGITEPMLAAAAQDVHGKAVIHKPMEVGNVLVQSPGEGKELGFLLKVGGCLFKTR